MRVVEGAPRATDRRGTTWHILGAADMGNRNAALSNAFSYDSSVTVP